MPPSFRNNETLILFFEKRREEKENSEEKTRERRHAAVSFYAQNSAYSNSHGDCSDIAAARAFEKGAQKIGKAAERQGFGGRGDGRRLAAEALYLSTSRQAPRNHPDEADHNDVSFRELNALMSSLKKTAEFHPAVRKTITFHLQQDDELVQVPLRLRTSGGECRHSITTSLEDFFAKCGFGSQFTWPKEYFPTVRGEVAGRHSAAASDAGSDAAGEVKPAKPTEPKAEPKPNRNRNRKRRQSRGRQRHRIHSARKKWQKYTVPAWTMSSRHSILC